MEKTKKVESNNIDLTIVNISLILIALYLIFYVLYIWASFIVPFVLSIFLAFFLHLTYSFFKKYIKSSILSYFLTFFVFASVFGLIYSIINSNINDIIDKAPNYQEKLRYIVDTTMAKIWIKEWEIYNNAWQHINIQTIFSYIYNLVTSIFGYTWIIIFYLLFILLEYKYLDTKFDLMVKDDAKQEKIFEIIREIKEDVKNYFIIKAFISFLSAFFSYIFMAAIWLDFALFWAFLMFMLNFIPNVWSIISTAFPVVFSLIQFNDLSHFLIVLFGLILIDTIVANILEPKLTWSRLNLSPLVILMALVFWSLIWWIIWAILSVPIMVILSIIFSKFPKTRWISILLSEKWNVKWIDLDTEFQNSKKELLQKIKKTYLRLTK